MKDFENGKDGKTAADLAESIAKAYAGKSSSDIWQKILEQAEKGKREGTLTNAELDNFYNTVAPMLDGFKRQKLRSVIVQLKKL